MYTDYQRKKHQLISEVIRPVKISRNDICPCGSGLKYKRCCGYYDPAKSE